MKTTMAIKGLILVSALSLSGVVGAQEAASPEPASSELDAVVVKDDQDLQNRTTVRAERVEQTQAEDIKESLKGVSDVMVGGGQRSAQKVYVRGVEDTQLNITVDGARQSGYLFHHQGRLSVDTELLKKIDVDAGTGNALSGPGAGGLGWCVLCAITLVICRLIHRTIRSSAVKAAHFNTRTIRQPLG